MNLEQVVPALPQRRLTDCVAFSARPAPPALLLFLLSFASTETPLFGSVHGAVEKGEGQEHNEHAETQSPPSPPPSHPQWPKRHRAVSHRRM